MGLTKQNLILDRYPMEAAVLLLESPGYPNPKPIPGTPTLTPVP